MPLSYLASTIGTLVKASLPGRRLGPLEEGILHLRVGLSDLDTNLHMNNSRYLWAMDFGRIDMLARQGVAKVALKQRWMPVIGAATIRYRRSLQPLEPFVLKTRIAGWTDKWFFIEQTFYDRKGRVAAHAAVKGLWRDRNGEPVSLDRIFAAMGGPAERLIAPAWILAWADAEEQQRLASKQAAAA